MIGSKQAQEKFAVSYFHGFLNSFPNPERRRLAAKTLMPGSAPALEWQYATRTVLAAQWGDGLGESHDTARLLYSLEPTLAYYIGQSVLNLSGTSLADIKTMRKTHRAPEYGFGINIGQIDSDTAPEYAFRRTPKQRLPLGVPSDARFLDFQVSLPVLAGNTLDVGSDDQLEIYPPAKERADFVAYAGTVCLDRDIKLYERSKQTRVGNLAFGNSRAFGTIYDVLQAFGGERAEVFGELLEQHEVSNASPLPDIAGLLATH